MDSSKNVGERTRKLFQSPVEIITKGKMGEFGRQIIHQLIEGCAKGEMGEVGQVYG